LQQQPQQATAATGGWVGGQPVQAAPPTMHQVDPRATMGAIEGATGGGQYPLSQGYSANVTQPTIDEQSTIRLQHSLGQEAFNQRFRTISGLLGKFGAGGGAGEPEKSGPDPQEEAARSAAFARAKSQQGQIARATLDSISDIMAGSGRAGSGIESELKAGAIQGGAGELAETTRQQAESDVERARQIADRNYAGDLTRRGQALGLQQSLLSLIGATMR
jgi:hypothetical protein